MTKWQSGFFNWSKIHVGHERQAQGRPAPPPQDALQPMSLISWLGTFTGAKSRDVEFNYRDGALEKVKDTTSRMLAVQVYANGRFSSGSVILLLRSRARVVRFSCSPPSFTAK